MSNNDQITNLLTIFLIVMVGILFILLIIFAVLKIKESNKNKPKKNKTKNNGKDGELTEKEPIEYTKKSIFSFMQFDRIEDNMIITKKGKRFVMAIECQGINYDLMSGVEKVSVEQGFLQFLNTLRHPIQIYVQTRTVNLGSSIVNYKDRLKQIQDRLVSKQMELNSMMSSGDYTEEEIQKENMEVVRERNLYEYGRDIITTTERMSLNKNILRKHYYVIISYTPEEVNNPNFSKEEVKDIAFNELYTRGQSIISSLAVCGINGKILNSNELAELLYVAYNRDESEVYQLEQALNAQYDELYTTAQDVLDRKMAELDKKIEEEAIKKANDTLLAVAEEREKEREIRKKENNLDDLVNRMAKMMIEENEDFVGKENAEEAKKKIDEESKKAKKTKEKGGDVNEEKQKTTTRRRKTTA